jgi:phage tail protein X
MDRYRNTKTITEPDTKKQYMESTIYPKVQASDNDFYVISDQGDRLDLLAYKYYNDVSMWWVIAVANNLNDANFYVEPGIQLRIPANMDKINNDLAKLNK